LYHLSLNLLWTPLREFFALASYGLLLEGIWCSKSSLFCAYMVRYALIANPPHYFEDLMKQIE
jgi:hypothetical protein